MNQKNKKSILWVDDRPEELELASLAVEFFSDKINLITYSSAESALEFLYDDLSSSNIQLIVLDMNMPKMNGIEVLQTIKSSNLHYIPVIILSSSGEPEDVQKAYRAGANGYSQKPSNFNDFQNLVSSLITYWTKHNVSYDHSPLEFTSPG